VVVDVVKSLTGLMLKTVEGIIDQSPSAQETRSSSENQSDEGKIHSD
jgi:hypothetical protein